MEYYYYPDLSADIIKLTQNEFTHCVKTLHHRIGDKILLTDGKENLAEGEIVSVTKTECLITLLNRKEGKDFRNFSLHIAIAPTKNRERIEWFLEKSIEIGIEKVSFMICEHSERTHLDLDRLNRVAISAIKQSKTTLLPKMEILTFDELMTKYAWIDQQKFIAWCNPDSETSQLTSLLQPQEDVLLLIGPEGDFSSKEIQNAKNQHFKEVLLGNKRLRTETAGLYCCCAVALTNSFTALQAKH
ncbi:MAG: 16S rRNA (uracil(1498)-N(3))-methyltransferase [Bacteroidales bacterium]|jgi:16S rRNA (uracil1498-N3)-methyltransferase|nr:16S rRNA (uracil(1498)-N(3))-methyltransferase [Bacteroidales bacterium]